MMNADLPPGSPRMSIDASCLAALAHALRGADLTEGAERLLRGLLSPLSIMGGVVVVRPAKGDPVVAAVDMPDAWVESWKDVSAADLDARCNMGLVTESLVENSGAIDPDLKLSGVRSLWALPLSSTGDPSGALVLVSRESGAFPPDVRLAVDAVSVAFGGWVAAHLNRPAGSTSSAGDESSARSSLSTSSLTMPSVPPLPTSDSDSTPNSRSSARPLSPLAGSSASASSSAWDILAIEPDLAVVRVDADRRVASWSPRAHRILGWTSDEIVGQRVDMLFLDEDHLSMTRRLLHQDDEVAGEWQVDLRLREGDAASCGVRIVDAGVHDGTESEGGSVLLFRDRRGEESAEKWLRWSRALLGVLSVSTLVLDPGGRIRELGSGWVDAEAGEQTDVWVGRHLADLVQSDRREVLAFLREAARQGEWTGRLVCGGRPVTMTLRAVRDEDGNLEALVGARRVASADDTRDLLQHIPLGIIRIDPELRIVETNPELESILGPDALPADAAGLDVRSLAVFQTQSAQSALDRLVATGEVDLPEVRLRGADRTSLLVHVSGGVMVDDAGEITGYLCTVTGRAGKGDVETQLMRAQKMESIGNFASGLAHDFGNFVSVILGKAGVLRVKLPGDPHITGDLEDIETAAKRAQHLAAELMRFARGGRNRQERLCMNRLIDDVGALIRTSVGKRIQLGLRLGEGIAEIRGDEVELQQMVLNLCLNARDAMPNGGRLVIETAPLTAAQRERLETGDDELDGICLSVKDTGVGMPPEVVERVFEPFYTTKDESHQGSGLGLAMVYGIVRRHGGTIDVHSTVGVGTSFEILLPAAPANLVNEPETGQRILVVDDEPAFREMIRLILEEDGFQVQLAANGIEALRTLRTEWQDLNLVILDLRMPGIDGLAVLEEIRGLTDTLPVLVTTGYAGTDEKEEAVRKGAQGVLEKPYRVSELRTALALALAAGSTPPGDAAQAAGASGEIPLP